MPGAGKTTVLTGIALWAESLQRWQEHDRQGGNKRGAPVTRQALLSTALSSFRELWPETGGWHRRTPPIILQAKLSTGADIAMQIRVDTTEQALVRPVPQVWDALAAARRETVPTVQHMGPCGPVPLDEPVYTSPARAHRTAHGATGQVIRNALLEAASHEDRWDRLVEAIREVCGWTVHRPVTDGPSLVVRCSHATHPDCELRQIGTTGQHAAMGPCHGGERLGRDRAPGHSRRSSGRAGRTFTHSVHGPAGKHACHPDHRHRDLPDQRRLGLAPRSALTPNPRTRPAARKTEAGASTSPDNCQELANQREDNMTDQATVADMLAQYPGNRWMEGAWGKTDLHHEQAVHARQVHALMRYGEFIPESRDALWIDLLSLALVTCEPMIDKAAPDTSASATGTTAATRDRGLIPDLATIRIAAEIRRTPDTPARRHCEPELADRLP